MKTGKIIVTTLAFFITIIVNAQGKYYTKAGKISFYSSTAVENIEAINKSAVVILDSKTGDIQFAVLMKGFEFKKALMQEDFNRDYVESSKFPKAEFKGQITNNSELNYSTDGNYPAKIKGKLTIHGETKDIETTGTISVKDSKVHAKSVFNIQIADYKITVRKLYKDNISSTIKITVDCSLDPMK
jgi:polyisoprenoid-binding protein YceI